MPSSHKLEGYLCMYECVFVEHVIFSRVMLSALSYRRVLKHNQKEIAKHFLQISDSI
jgi:hypothetical protein